MLKRNIFLILTLISAILTLNMLAQRRVIRRTYTTKRGDGGSAIRGGFLGAGMGAAIGGAFGGGKGAGIGAGVGAAMGLSAGAARNRRTEVVEEEYIVPEEETYKPMEIEREAELEPYEEPVPMQVEPQGLEPYEESAPMEIEQEATLPIESEEAIPSKPKKKLATRTKSKRKLVQKQKTQRINKQRKT